MANTYDIGDLVRSTVTFSTATGTAADPSTVRILYQDPSGNEATYVYGSGATVGKATTGSYYVDVAVDEAGEWAFKWTGTTACQAVVESYILVRASLL